MDYYVIQVIPRKEENFLNHTRTIINKNNVNFLLPRRKLEIRKGGSWKESFAPIFPGYIFLKTKKINVDLYYLVKKIPGFIRFLLNNHNITPIYGKDREILLHLISFGEVVGKSKACFNDKNRIRILSGPLKGLEGRIVKVNRRKKRVKIQLYIYDNSFKVDFGFDDVKEI